MTVYNLVLDMLPYLIDVNTRAAAKAVQYWRDCRWASILADIRAGNSDVGLCSDEAGCLVIRTKRSDEHHMGTPRFTWIRT